MSYKCEVCGKGLGDSVGWNALGDRRIHTNCQWVEIDRLRECRDILEELILPETDAGMPLGLWCAIHRVLGKEVPERRPKCPKPERCEYCGNDDMDEIFPSWHCGHCTREIHGEE